MALNPSNVLDAPPCDPSDLCGQCAKVIPRRADADAINGIIPTNYDRIDIWPDFPGLEKSAQAGCFMCGFFKTSVLAVRNAATYAEQANSTHPFWGEDGSDQSMSMPWDRRIRITCRFLLDSFNEHGTSSGDASQHGGTVTALWLGYKPASGNLKDENGRVWGASVLSLPIFDSVDLESSNPETRRRLLSRHTLSSDNVSMMRQWVADCKHHHPKCPPFEHHWVPTRLVEFYNKCGVPSVRLVETTDEFLHERRPFAALSHMWGDITVKPPLCTLTYNLQELKKGVEISRVSKNFVEALEVAAQLCIPYVWIDSLCIVQDSNSDWEEQAKLMHMVYRYADVTIVATAATSSHDGFLARDIEKIDSLRVRYSTQTADPSCKKADHYFVMSRLQNSEDSHRMHAVDGAKWNTRGWTMQERSLSTRSIHFCRNKIFFECRTCLKSEENEPAQEMELAGRLMWPRGRDLTMENIYDYWELLLGEYCRRTLTRSSDKLAAIRSIAEEMKEVTGMDYISFAGMWRPYIQRELLWCVVPFGGDPIKPTEYRAPTWSWASLEAYTNVPDSVLSGTKRTIPQHLTVWDNNPFEVLDLFEAQIDSIPGIRGCLKVRGLVKRIHGLQRTSNPGPYRRFYPSDLRLTSGALGLFAHGKLDLDGETYRTRLLYLHVSHTSRITGLILAECDGEKGLYVRVGIASLFDDKTGQILLETVFSADEKVEDLVLI